MYFREPWYQKPFVWVIGLFLIFAFIGGCYHNSTKTEVTATVEEKWIKAAPGSSEQSYMLSTDKGILSIQDNFFFAQFRSSDIYARAKVGETYCFKVSGVRIGLFSEYQNVYGFCEVVQ